MAPCKVTATLITFSADVSVASGTLSAAHLSFTLTNAPVKTSGGPSPLQALELVYCMLKALCHVALQPCRRRSLGCKFQTSVSVSVTRGLASAFCAPGKDMWLRGEKYIYVYLWGTMPRLAFHLLCAQVFGIKAIQKRIIIFCLVLLSQTYICLKYYFSFEIEFI